MGVGRVSNRGICAGAVAIVAAGLIVGASSAPGQPQRPFIDTIDVNVVNVEVVVTDRSGAPVTDLEADSFTVWEDGVQMELSNFFAVDGGRVLPPAGEGDGLTILPRPDTQQLQLVVLVDDLNIRPENRNRVIDELRAYIARAREAGDLMMLVRTGDEVIVEQTFTSDAGLVVEALDRMAVRLGRHVEFDLEYYSLMRQIQSANLPMDTTLDPLVFQAALMEAERLGDEIRVVASGRYRKVVRTVELLERFTRTLAGIPGRKGILYISDGMPARSAESLVTAWQGKFGHWLMNNNRARVISRVASLRSLQFDATPVLSRLVAEANANHVAFYPITGSRRRSQALISAESRGDFSVGNSGPGSTAVANMEAYSLDESLLQLADGTGGFAFTSSSNIGGLVERIRSDFTSFYSLGYLRSKEADDRYHKLEVKVANPRLRVRHLEGFRLRDPLAHLQDLTLSALHHDLESNPLEVRLEPGEQLSTGKDHYLVSVTVTIPFRNLLMIPERQSHVAQLVLVIVARHDHGGVSQPQRIELPIRVPNERILETADSRAVYPLQLEMRPGPQKISVGVRDRLGRVDSTLSLALDVGAVQALPLPPGFSIWRRSERAAEPATLVAKR